MSAGDDVAKCCWKNEEAASHPQALPAKTFATWAGAVVKAYPKAGSPAEVVPTNVPSSRASGQHAWNCARLRLRPVRVLEVQAGEDGALRTRLKERDRDAGLSTSILTSPPRCSTRRLGRIGDAGRYVDPTIRSRASSSTAALVEDFKLTSGTFVLVGTLRTTAIAAAALCCRMP